MFVVASPMKNVDVALDYINIFPYFEKHFRKVRPS